MSYRWFKPRFQLQEAVCDDEAALTKNVDYFEEEEEVMKYMKGEEEKAGAFLHAMRLRGGDAHNAGRPPNKTSRGYTRLTKYCFF